MIWFSNFFSREQMDLLTSSPDCRMSDLQSPASDRAPIADTPARSDHAPIADTQARASVSTNVMVALNSDEDPITLFGNMPILSLLMHCLRQIGSERGTKFDQRPQRPCH